LVNISRICGQKCEDYVVFCSPRVFSTLLVWRTMYSMATVHRRHTGRTDGQHTLALPACPCYSIKPVTTVGKKLQVTNNSTFFRHCKWFTRNSNKDSKR